MKKRWIVFFLVMLASLVIAAPSVTLDNPSSGNYSNLTSIIFSCSFTDASYDISTVALWTDVTGTWSQTDSVSSNTIPATFTVSSLTAGSYNWNCLVTNSNAETAYASSNNTFNVSLISYLSDIPNVTWDEDSTNSDAFDLDTYFDNAASYIVSSTSYIAITIDADNEVTFVPPANYSGTETVTFTANDAGGSTTSNSVLLTVTNLEDPPSLLETISDQSIDVNEDLTIDVSSYFNDPDGNETLNYSISASHLELIEDNNKILTIRPEYDWEGQDNISLSATDGSTTVESNYFIVTIGAEGVPSSDNSEPEFNVVDPDPDNPPSIELGDSLEFGISISDDDDDDLTITWYVDEVDQEVSEEAFTFTPDAEGTYTIKVVVTDGTDEIAEEWTITVGEGLLDDETSEEVEEIITETETETVCGNNIIEEGETCSSCSADVVCDSGYSCSEGECIKDSSSIKTIGTFLIVLISIVIFAILIYYFTTLKKGGKKKEPNVLDSASNVRDFYKKK